MLLRTRFRRATCWSCQVYWYSALGAAGYAGKGSVLGAQVSLFVRIGPQAPPISVVWLVPALRMPSLASAGFQLIKGLPIERYSQEESTKVYWGLGQYWGRVVPQNGKGHLVGHVRVSPQPPNRPMNT